jgi:hypothetical protein
MCVSIMAASPIRRGATWRANGSACGAPDYWVNGLGGAPFFVLTQPVNPGLIAVLRQSIVPRLVVEAPQPSAEALAADPLLPRFTLIFDREGYSPDFFAELEAQRIAILTYHKYRRQMASDRVRRHSVRLHNGEIVELELAERGTRLTNNLWVRKVRRLNLKAQEKRDRR